MPNIKIMTTDGRQAAIPAHSLELFRGRLRGPVLVAGDQGYDVARSVWNAMIDRNPAMIARCSDVDDVMESVRFAQQADALFTVRGGGHNIAGNAVSDGALMIDLSPMNGVKIDPTTRRVRVGPGATLADLDRETAAHGVVVPTGINSTTGVSGLTLGGGFGWLSRALGLTIDSLVSADVVVSGGELLRASASENSDLFWALRGGGGNFGVVVSFEFQGHVMRRDLLSGLIVLPFERAREALKIQRDLTATMPDELTLWTVLRHAPPLPFLPENVHGEKIAVLALCYAGDPEEGQRVIAPLRAIESPIGFAVGVQPFTAWQQALDPLLTEGARNYWKSHDIPEMSDTAIETIVSYAAKLPGDETEIFVAHLGGAVSRTGSADTAFVQRQPHFVMNAHTRWRDPSDDAAFTAWARGLYADMKPHSAGVYVNFMPSDEAGRVAEAYGANFDRLARIKARYDPGNLFRMNQNIPPRVVVEQVG